MTERIVNATVPKIPCSFTPQRKRKGIASLPDHPATIDRATRDAILIAIAKAKKWIDDLATGEIASFEEIADQEGKVVRHIRFLAPLAFVSPKVIKAIMQSNVPADLTISSLARNLPHNWSEQERQLGLV
jgi:site-specific DNA recombinase